MSSRDIAGRRNGRLVAVAATVQRSKDGHVMWSCICDCGQQCTVQSNNLSRENGTKSCGCLLKEAARARIKREGSWNDGRSYAINTGSRCYKTRHAWAKAAIREFGPSCQDCGWNRARCDVHHRLPKANGGLHTLTNAIVLCPNCHRVRHEHSCSANTGQRIAAVEASL